MSKQDAVQVESLPEYTGKYHTFEVTLTDTAGKAHGTHKVKVADPDTLEETCRLLPRIGTVTAACKRLVRAVVIPGQDACRRNGRKVFEATGKWPSAVATQTFFDSWIAVEKVEGKAARLEREAAEKLARQVAIAEDDTLSAEERLAKLVASLA